MRRPTKACAHRAPSIGSPETRRRMKVAGVDVPARPSLSAWSRGSGGAAAATSHGPPVAPAFEVFNARSYRSAQLEAGIVAWRISLRGLRKPLLREYRARGDELERARRIDP